MKYSVRVCLPGEAGAENSSRDLVFCSRFTRLIASSSLASVSPTQSHQTSDFCPGNAPDLTLCGLPADFLSSRTWTCTGSSAHALFPETSKFSSMSGKVSAYSTTSASWPSLIPSRSALSLSSRSRTSKTPVMSSLAHLSASSLVKWGSCISQLSLVQRPWVRSWQNSMASRAGWSHPEEETMSTMACRSRIALRTAAACSALFSGDTASLANWA
mmetsp:Transcript_7077/g.25637  ORF Transcript_7077/g.25637 Transcript_7077/m.25637 type:complete len:215 (+) Transcript_7077:1011-1655(+)